MTVQDTLLRGNQMNIFRNILTGELDRKYLRVCAVYKLLRRNRIGEARAIELLAERHTAKEMKILRGIIELWTSGPIPNMAA